MEMRNKTPFLMQAWDTWGSDRNLIGTLLVRGRFRFVQNGDEWHLLPHRDQGELNTADRFWGEPGKSSVRFPSDYIPGKPGADIILNACAWAPGNIPAERWEAGVEIGDHKYDFTVSGKRFWKRNFGWWLTETEPCLNVPVRYENAYGGGVIKAHTESKPEYLAFSRENPIGCGLLHNHHPLKQVPVPQIEMIGQEANELQPYKEAHPAGLGAIGRSWSPRIELAGSFDDNWLANGHPYLPDDFDPAHYHDAHPDLILPNPLKGDEQIRLKNLSPETPDAIVRLPNIKLLWVLESLQGHKMFDRMTIDTVLFDMENGLEQGSAYLSWRSRYPVTDNNQRIIAAMIMDKEQPNG